MEIESAGGVRIKKNKKDVTHCGFGNSSWIRVSFQQL
jgi:ribosomal protein L37E